jgi:hypothetical protein
VLSRLYHDANNLTAVIDGNAALLAELVAAGAGNPDAWTDVIDDIRLGCSKLQELVESIDSLRKSLDINDDGRQGQPS